MTDLCNVDIQTKTQQKLPEHSDSKHSSDQQHKLASLHTPLWKPKLQQEPRAYHWNGENVKEFKDGKEITKRKDELIEQTMRFYKTLFI
jgi:hypothetical protein